MASIAQKGQASKVCGTSDHLNVNFSPNQALAEHTQVMFDQFFPLALIALQHLQLKYPCDAIKDLLVAIDTVFAFDT